MTCKENELMKQYGWLGLLISLSHAAIFGWQPFLEQA
jgi:hypothetical protein